MRGRTLTAELLRAVQETEIGGLVGIVHRQNKHSSDSYREPYLATRYVLGLLSEKTLQLKGVEAVIPTSITVDSCKSSPLDDLDSDLITEKMRDRYRLQSITIERVFEEDFGKGLRHPVIYNELYDENPSLYEAVHPAVEVVYGEQLVGTSPVLAYARGRHELAAFFANYASLS